MTSSAWTERHLSELNELFELAQRLEYKIRGLKSLSSERPRLASGKPGLDSMPVIVSLNQ